jgi:hypothetical protein
MTPVSLATIPSKDSDCRRRSVAKVSSSWGFLGGKLHHLRHLLHCRGDLLDAAGLFFGPAADLQ